MKLRYHIFIWLLVCGGTTLLYAGSTNGEIKLQPLPDNVYTNKAPTKHLPSERYVPGAKVQTASYTVIDSLFNAFSYYGSNQTSVVWDPKTNAFVTIKRGALPPTAQGTSDHGNNVFILFTTDNGQSWSRVGPVLEASRGALAGAGAPRYPAVAMLYDDATNPTIEGSAFGYYSPITDGSSWVGVAAGFLPNQLGASPNNELLPRYDVNGASYAFGTTFSTTSVTTGPDSIFAFAYGSLFPAVTGSVPTSENNNLVLIRTNVFGFQQFEPYIPPPLLSSNFVDPGSAQSRTSAEVAIDQDANKNLYVGVFGRFTVGTGVDPARVTLGVAKSTDQGMTWSDLNVMPHSVIDAYAQANGGDASTSGFAFSWDWLYDQDANTRVTAAKDFVVTGEDRYSFAAQLLLVQGQSVVGVHYVEVYYENGQWGIRKIADASLFESSGTWSFDVGGEIAPSQLGCELQLGRTSDYSALLFKTLEARLLIWGGDTLLTTDVVVSARPVSVPQWDVLRNVTQSTMLDRITWIPKVIPPAGEHIPLLTVQTANRGLSDREYYWDNQFLLASASQDPTPDEVLRYRQYVTYSLFNYEDLPEWNPSSSVTVYTEHLDAVALPNPASDVVTISVRAVPASVASFELVDVTGKVVYTGKAIASGEQVLHTIDVARLPIGAYRCIIRSGAQYEVVPIQIVR